MAYISRAERQRQEWMTLNEAIRHIRQVDRCDEAAALQRLRKALGDGAVEARWGSDEFSSQLFEIQPRRPLRLATFWLTVPINEGGGFIPGVYQEDWWDPDDEDPANYLPKRYYVFVLKDSFFQHWESHSEGSQHESLTKNEPASEVEIREAARQVYDEAEALEGKPPNINQAADLIVGRLEPKRALRKQVRPILDEEAFRRRRQPRGVRPKKK
jgi:hypothetical protein